ncbi:hypothetical protein DIPPA_07843 [Diplonema papillatum]|nr:hypothetical protein DIPPA_07843 [Diplonema papillatum]
MQCVAFGIVGCAVGYCVGRQSRKKEIEEEDAGWSRSVDTYVPNMKHVSRRLAKDAGAGTYPKRDVVCSDAMEWMRQVGVIRGCVISGLPDVSEMLELGDAGYAAWFSEAVTQIVTRLDDGMIACFHQTDTRINRIDTLSKAELVFRAVRESKANVTLLWHKVALATPCGVCKVGRPSFTHMICYVKGPADPVRVNRCNRLLKVPDCMDRGTLLWSRGMGVIAAMKTIEYIKCYLDTSDVTIVDPFCGHGTIPAVANTLGLPSIGIDLSTKCCKATTKATTDDLLVDRKRLISARYDA